jgi:hypothetical protein
MIYVRFMCAYDIRAYALARVVPGMRMWALLLVVFSTNMCIPGRGRIPPLNAYPLVLCRA